MRRPRSGRNTPRPCTSGLVTQHNSITALRTYDTCFALCLQGRETGLWGCVRMILCGVEFNDSAPLLGFRRTPGAGRMIPVPPRGLFAGKILVMDKCEATPCKYNKNIGGLYEKVRFIFSLLLAFLLCGCSAIQLDRIERLKG